MISSIRWGTGFGTVVVSENRILPCFFEVSLSFTQNTTSEYEQSIALERVSVLFSQVLESALLISAEHELLDLFECGTETRVVTLPDQPSMQLLGQVLLEKISAVTEGKILVDFLSISSSETAGAEYILDATDADSRFSTSVTELGTPAWWLRNDLTVSDYIHDLESGEQVILGTDLAWTDLELGWQPPQQIPESGAEVVPFRPRVVGTKNETKH
jgi:hypothetical protein